MHCRRIAVLASALVMGLNTSRVVAISVVPVSPERAIARADMIVVATVIGATTKWTNASHRMIATDYRFRLDRVIHDPDALFGRVTRGDSIALSFAGGTVGDESVWIPGIPRFEDGEQVILLIDGRELRSISPLVGINAGLYRTMAAARGDVVIHGASGAPVTRTFFSSASDRENGFTLDEFVQEIERALPIAKSAPELPADAAVEIPDDVRHLVFTGEQISTVAQTETHPRKRGAAEPPRADSAASPEVPGPTEFETTSKAHFVETHVDGGAARYSFLWLPPTPPSVFNIPPAYYTNDPWGLNFEYALSDWNRYASGFFMKYATSDNNFGHQGRNDFAFTDPLTFLRRYGFALGGTTLAIAVMYNSAGNDIQIYQRIVESDVILNINQAWTLDWNVAYDNFNIWYFRSTVIHELGHTFGREHQFTESAPRRIDWHSVMNYPPAGALDTEFWTVFADDAASIRAAYPLLTAPITDLGVHLFRTLDNGGQPVPVYWSSFPSGVTAGGSFTVSEYVIENLGTSDSTPSIDWYLTPGRQSFAEARPCSSSSFPILPTATQFTATSVVTVPSSVPPGDYYLAAALPADDNDWNRAAWSKAIISVAEAACPAGEVSWLDPVDLVVDARQPHEIGDASLPQGIRTITAKAPIEAGDGCWSLEEIPPGEPGNSIAGVVYDGPFEDAGMYTITLARPPAPGSVTTITFAATAGRRVVRVVGTFTSRPGDADAGGTASVDDIRAMIDCCLDASCAPFGAYSCDIDHSGTVGSADLARLIDVLNGAGEFAVP